MMIAGLLVVTLRFVAREKSSCTLFLTTDFNDNVKSAMLMLFSVVPAMLMFMYIITPAVLIVLHETAGMLIFLDVTLAEERYKNSKTK